MAGFEWAYNLSGGRPLILTFRAADTETLTKGDIMNVESGEVDLAASADTGLAGALVGAFDPKDERDSNGDPTPGVIAATDSVTRLKVIVNPDAVYAVDDDNASNAGASLDLTGATGAQGLAASGDNEFVVVATKEQSTDKTLVMIQPAVHYLAKEQ